MRGWQFALVLVSVALSVQVNAKTFMICELARALAKEGVPKTLISNFVCLAEAVSGSQTTKATQSTPTSFDYGIYQINTKDSCSKAGRPGGRCNMQCEKLLDDNISDDIQCALKIQTELGFKNWKRWNVRCKSPDPRDLNKYLPNLTNCYHK